MGETGEKVNPGNSILEHPAERAGASGEWLEAKLIKETLQIHSKSRLASGLSDLKQFRELARSKETLGRVPIKKQYDFYANAFGTDFLTKSLHWGSTVGLKVPQNRWSQLTSSNPIITTSGISTKPRNCTWETVIASIAKTFSEDVKFAEPDLICSFKSQNIAVAAKMTYSEKSVIENFRAGLRQAKKSDNCEVIDAILIFLNVTNIYPLLETFEWSTRTRFESPDHLRDKLMEDVTKWSEKFSLKHEAERFLKRSEKPVGLAFFVPFVVCLNGNPLPFFYTHTPIIWSANSLDYQVATAFLNSCNNVLGFTP